MSKTSSTFSDVDSAPIFAIASSIWDEFNASADKIKFNLNSCYGGMDEFMRVVMSVALRFEVWANQHVDFSQTTEVWSYLLQDKFGEACLQTLGLDGLKEIDEEQLLLIGLELNLPIYAEEGMAVPIDVAAENPLPNSQFKSFRIRTVRDEIGSDSIEPFVLGDEASDEYFGEIYFGLYGIKEDGSMEHIADRSKSSEILDLARNLAPGIEFPERLTSMRIV